jgi:predicted phosphoadenosine phosphosulfate sulfurtransferase
MNVYEKTQQRLKKIFDEFDYVYVSFSGGKDSGVLLNLAIDYIRDNGLNKRLGVFHIDYEAQYQMTTDYVDETFSLDVPFLDFYRICMPISAQCSTSMRQDHWVPWNKDEQDIWVREMPKNCINEHNHTFGWWRKEMWDYELQNRFGGWLKKRLGVKKMCCLVGIRTQESLNRWRAIYSDRNINKYDGNRWTTQIEEGVVNAYPIHDWTTSDIWVANARFGWSYNRLYDLYYQAGLSIDQMRVASPFNDCAQNSLKLYRVIDPNNWAKMVGRVNGVNFTGIYGGTTAMGWKSIKLPNGHTWESYMYFLLDTLPEETRRRYLDKLAVSVKFWRERGGCLSSDVIGKLRERGVEIEVDEHTNYKTDKLPVRMEYLDDIDIAEFKEIPTYKRMCVCIMKNDHLCKYMGFSQTKMEMKKRKDIIDKYNEIL